MKTVHTLKFVALMGVLSCSLTASCSEKSPKKPSDYQNVAANTTYTPSNTASPTSQTSDPQAGRVSATKVKEQILCPEANTLSKNGLFWGAPNGWRSFAQSFVDEIQGFVGAQWHGVNVGKMMCIYVGTQKRSFPVVLQNDLLTEVPTGYKWGGLKNGMVECKSENINDCPFFHTKTSVDMEQVYDDLNFKKEGEDDLN